MAPAALFDPERFSQLRGEGSVDFGGAFESCSNNSVGTPAISGDSIGNADVMRAA